MATSQTQAAPSVRQRDERREEQGADRRVSEGIGVGPVVERRWIRQHPFRGLLVAAGEVEGEVCLHADPDDDSVGQQDADRCKEDQRAGTEVTPGRHYGYA